MMRPRPALGDARSLHFPRGSNERQDGLLSLPRDVLQKDEGRHLFGRDPSGYEAGRPDYPSFVYEDLRDRCGLAPGAQVLEVGPGTGIVTRHLLSAGARVVAVEPDPPLASYLSDAHQDDELEVIGATLEAAELDRGRFDLAVAATSFHWVDQRQGLRKVRDSVRPGGWIALWWTLFRDPNQPDAFSTAVEDLLGPATRGGFDEPNRPPFQLDDEHRRRDLAIWAQAQDVESRIVPWTCILTPAQARALYASMATVIRRPLAEQQALLDQIEVLASETFGGQVERNFVTAFYTGRCP